MSGIHIFRGTAPQVRNGIGGIFRAMGKSVMPVATDKLGAVGKAAVKKTLAAAGKQLAHAVLNAGAGYVGDLVKGKHPKKSLKKRKSQAVRRVQNAGKKDLKQEAAKFVASLAGVQSQANKSNTGKRRRNSTPLGGKRRKKTETAFDFV